MDVFCHQKYSSSGQLSPAVIYLSISLQMTSLVALLKNEDYFLQVQKLVVCGNNVNSHWFSKK